MASAPSAGVPFEVVNGLKAQLKELRVKFENQSELLVASEKKNRALTSKLNSLLEVCACPSKKRRIHRL